MNAPSDSPPPTTSELALILAPEGVELSELALEAVVAHPGAGEDIAKKFGKAQCWLDRILNS